MAKVTLNPILQTLQGKIGECTNRISNGLQILQQNAIPYATHKQPRSPAQVEIWRRYGNLYHAYTRLTPLQKNHFTVQAKNLHISAWNIYVKKYIQDPDGPPVLPPPSFKITVDNSTSHYDITNSPARLILSNVPELFTASNNDPTTLEIYTNDRTTPTGFYVESWNPGTASASIILNATTERGTTVDYYLEVNPDRITELSNHAAVYMFYEDFADWPTLSERWQGDISYLTPKSGGALLQGASKTVTTIQQFNDCIIEWQGYQTGDDVATFGLYNPSPQVLTTYTTYGPTSAEARNTGPNDGCGWQPAPMAFGSLKPFKIVRLSSFRSDFLMNGAHLPVSPCKAAAANIPAGFYMYVYKAPDTEYPFYPGDACFIKNLHVRKFADPEPTAELTEIIINE